MELARCHSQKVAKTRCQHTLVEQSRIDHTSPRHHFVEPMSKSEGMIMPSWHDHSRNEKRGWFVRLIRFPNDVFSLPWRDDHFVEDNVAA
jgi:hypothetical protein